MKTDANALIGQTFNEMYRIVRQIGTGGMGAVYESVHTRLANKKFAIKMLHASIAQDAEVFQRFRREAEIATELGHPNIVEVSDFNITPEGSPYMVMEFLDGEDLAARLQKRGPMGLDQMQRMVAEICSALEAAHGAGIVHRDLKPQNIFLCKKLGRDDFVKIVDFGISKVKDSSSVVTRDHSLMGTPFYMSPEQADGLVQQIDHRTDIFALGAIMWEMLTCRMAFEAPTISGAMYKVVHIDAPEVHLIRPDVPPMVSLVLRRAMAKQKEWRYGNVMELSQEFANACRGIPPSIAPPPMQGVATMAPSPQLIAQQQMGTPPRAASQPAMRSGDAYAQTGYVTPTPGQPIPPHSQPPNSQPPYSQPYGQPQQFGTPPPQQFGTPPPQQFGTPPPQQFGTAPHQQFGTAPPQQQFGTPPPQQFGTPPPQQFGTPYPATAVPPQLMTPTNVPPHMMGGQPVQQMMPPPVQQMVAPVSTIGGSSGQMVSTQQTAPRKGKGTLYGAIAAVVLLGGGAAVAIPMMGSKDTKPTPVAGGDGDKGPKLMDVPDAAVAKIVEAPVTPPDAAVAIASKDPTPVPDEKPAAPVESDVTLTFDVQYEKGKAPKAPAAKIMVAGQLVSGGTLTIKKGSTKLKVDVTEKGYSSYSGWVVPDGDKKVSTVLKAKPSGPGVPGIGWIP